MDCMEAMVDAAGELSVDSLGFGDNSLLETRGGIPEIPLGSFVAMTGENENLQIGLVASKETCAEISRRLLGMEPEDGELEEDDLVDALGEIVNILAGGAKTRMPEEGPGMAIGLPMVLRGSIGVPHSTEVHSSVLKWDDIEVIVLLIRHKK